MVYIHQCEINEIRRNSQEHRRKESGGDLFGLWTNSGHAVVHLVSGITKTSSLNSIAVSSREGVNDLKILLEEKYMLCHIGKWRFNPSVTSSEPSATDEAAVERFYSRSDGQKLKACILLKFSEGKAGIQTYLFMPIMGKNQHIPANLNILSGSQSSNQVTENPLRNVPAIREKLQSGTPLSIGQSRGSNNGETFKNESGELGKSPAKTPTFLSLSHQSASSQTTSIPPSQPCFVSQSTTQSSALLQGIQTVNSSAQSPSSTTPKPPPKLNDAGEKILKQVQEKVKDLKTVVLYCEPSSTGDVDLKLEANQIKCTVHFPVTFPEKPAKVFCRLPKQPCIFEVKHPNKKFDSLNSILSVVKWRFEYHIDLSSLSSANTVTTTAPQVNDDSLRSEAPPDINVDDMGGEVLKFAEEVRDKIKKSFETTGDVELEVKTKKSEKKVELTFQHYYNDRKWLVVLPAKFREQRTEIYHINILGRKSTVVQEVCELSDQTVTVIKKSCICGQCFRPR